MAEELKTIEGDGAAEQQAVAEEPVAEEAETPEAPAEEPVSEEAEASAASVAAAPSAAAEKGAAAWKVVRGFLTPERIAGLVAILLIPCFLGAWVHSPATEKVGVNVSLSMPDVLSAGAGVVGALENAADVVDEVRGAVDALVDFADEAVDVLGVVSAVMNADSDDYKEALTDAINRLVDDVSANSDNEVVSAVAAKAGSAASAAASNAVDSAAEKVKGTEVESAANTAKTIANEANEKAQNAQAAAEEAQSAVAEVQAAYNSGLSTVKTLLSVASAIWYLFLLLLLVAGILLLTGVRGRYVTGIVAFSLATVASVGSIVGISIANQAILDALVSALGMWVAALTPCLIEVKLLVWIVAVLSILGIVLLALCLSKQRKMKVAKA